MKPTKSAVIKNKVRLIIIIMDSIIDSQCSILSVVVSEFAMLCILLIFCICLQGVDGQNNLSRNSLEQEDDMNCPPWFHYNSTSEKCKCFHHPDVKVDVICTESEALLNFGSCMTYDNTTRITSLGQCVSFLVEDRNVSMLRNYIQLPKNLSELNEYMCAPMNRKGRVCSECIDGFGPSVFTYGFQCANYTGAWHGIPVYLLLEFAPITIFYFIILAFQISVTKAPMTGFILYSQLYSSFISRIICNISSFYCI